MLMFATSMVSALAVTQSTPAMTQDKYPRPYASKTLTPQRRAPGATPTTPMLLSTAAAVPPTWVPWPWSSAKDSLPQGPNRVQFSKLMPPATRRSG